MSTVDARRGGAFPAEGAFRVRPLREGDLPQVMPIELECFSTPWKEGTFRSLMRRTDTDIYVAETGGRVVGYAAAWTVIDQSELGNVAVTAAARGAGIGGALVDAIVERVRRRGSRECFLEVRESNHRAQALYRRRGFAVVGRRRAYYAAPMEDALVMRLVILDTVDAPGV
ncbi:MAG TPA: ribosomal protein S18-alanine N-acetyltransferase [Longimicrobiaceae bacterium]|nr:ribosomal protein S18-alanine N-acetyltransferase [Longimicrobiaceae bacterium]